MLHVSSIDSSIVVVTTPVITVTHTPLSLRLTCMVRTRFEFLILLMNILCDVLATVFKADPLDPERGQRYRDKILRFGGSREELDSLKVGILFSSSYFSHPMSRISSDVNRILRRS